MRLLSPLLVLALIASACSGSSTTTPTATLNNFSISLPGSGFLVLGQASQLTATETLSSGTTQDVTTTATWQSSNSSVATVSSTGVVTAVATGATTITAAYLGGTAGTLVVVVNGTSVVSMLIVGPGSLGTAQTSQLIAAASLRGGMTQDVTNSAAWQSSHPGVATVSSAGLLTAVAPGTTTITASYLGKAGALAVTVNDSVTSILLFGPTSLTASATGQFIAAAMMSSGPEQIVTNTVAWASSNPGVATVSSTGLVTAVATGATTITATYQGVAASVALTVN
jgi:uncharacterized protein YjdB